MKVVILNGSPDKTGVTKQITDYIFSDSDCELKEYWAYDLEAKACIDCQYCFKNPNQCIIKDDFQILMEDFKQADLIVLASPLHFSSFTGELLTSISRMQYIFALTYVHKLPSDFKEKKALTIITGGNDYPSMFKAISPVDTIIYNHLNVKEKERLLIKATDKSPVTELIQNNITEINEIRKYVRG